MMVAMKTEQMPIEYFVIRNLGYDGLMVMKYATLVEAEKYYKDETDNIDRWVKEHGLKDADKGIALIEGKILRKNDIDFD